MFEYLLFVIIIAFAVYRPAISLGLLLQIHVLRVSVSPDIDIMCILKNECQIDNSPLFGVILPIIVFSIIIINILLKNKGRITYKITAFDIFFFINCTLMIAGCLWSPDFIHSLDITCRYILLGISYFYIIRLYFQNHYDYKILLNQFIVSSYIISLILTCVGVYYYIHIGYVTRMTIPGSHPIPFSMMIGQGFLIAFGIFFTGGKLINQTQLWFQISNIGILFFFLFCQLLTNTRGVTIFMSISVALLFLLNMQRIGFSKIIAFIPIIFGIFSVILFQFNIEDLFQRFSVGLTHDESINERLIAWQETLEMLTNNPIFGVGTDGYQYYGHLAYPHNYFLEMVVSFGIFGVILSITIIALFLYYAQFLPPKRGGTLEYQFIYAVTLFYFFESCVSFTLWMHKGLYLWIGLLMILPQMIQSTNKKKRNNI